MKQENVPLIDLPPFITSNKDPDLVITEDFSQSIRHYPIRTNFYGIGFCFKGKSKIKIDFTEYVVEENCFVIFKSNQVTEVLEFKEDGKGMIVAFTEEFITRSNALINFPQTFSFFDIAAKPSAQLKKSEVIYLKALLKELQDKASRKEHPFQKQISSNLLLSFLYEFEAIYLDLKLSTKKKPTRKNELALQFHNHLVKNYKSERSVKFYADALFISPKYLSELLLEVNGRSAHQLINNMVALEARLLLTNKKYSLCEVAEHLKFATTATFGKFFKKQTGLTPGSYRQGVEAGKF